MRDWPPEHHQRLYHCDFFTRQASSKLLLTGPQVAGLAVDVTCFVTDTNEAFGDCDVLVCCVVDVRADGVLVEEDSSSGGGAGARAPSNCSRVRHPQVKFRQRRSEPAPRPARPVL